MRKYFLKIWPIVAIFFTVATFFYPVWLENKIPLPADFIVGTYYPWLDYKWGGYGAGVPVKNPITTDVVSFMFPMQMYTIDLLKQGIVPLWNNLILTGTPLLANFQSAPFSPTNFLYFLFDKLTAWSLQIIFQPFLAAVFLYLLLREFGRSKSASLAGGVFFAFGGFMTIWLEWNGHSLVAAFFPLIIWLTLKWTKSRKLKWAVLLSISLALQIFSGYPQIILYEFLALVILVLIFESKLILNPRRLFISERKNLFILSFFILLGIGLAAMQIVPGLEILQLSQRKVEIVLNEWAFLPWQLLITFVAPDFYGNHATKNYWGPADYTLTTGFSGVVVIILATLGFLRRFREKEVKFALLLIFTSLLIALPNPLSVAFKESGFLGLQAASAHRALVLSNLGFAILASFGLDVLLTSKIRVRDFLRCVYIPMIMIFGFGIGIFLAIWWFNHYPSSLQLQEVVKAISSFKVGLRNLVLPAIFLIGSALLLFISVYLRKWNRIFVMGLVVMGTIELFRFGWKFTPFSPREFVYPKTPVLEFLSSQKGLFRVAAEDVVPINMMMPYKIETLEGYDAVYPLSIAQYLSTLNSGQVDATAQGRYGSISNVDSPLFDLSNTRFILALKRDENGQPDENGQLPKKYQKTFLNKVLEDKTVVVLENTQSLPRAFFVTQWQTVEDDEQVLKILLDKNFPRDKKILLEDDFNTFPQSPINSAQVEYLKDDPDKKELEVKTDKDGLLFISDSWFPGWEARVDDTLTVPVFKADYTFRAIPINNGSHNVKIYYQPDSFRLGFMISLGSGLILVLLAITRILRRYK